MLAEFNGRLHPSLFGLLAFGKQPQTFPPTAAIREALVNAVVRRDYAIIGSKILLEAFIDRVDITSPGALPNHLPISAVRRGGRTRTRNEQMAHYMLDRNFMEKRSRGWLVMRKAMLEFNGSEPEMIEDEAARFVTVTCRLPPGARV